MPEIKHADKIQLTSDLHDRPVSLDLRWKDNYDLKPVVLHIHGFKGFKDWGYFNLMSRYFAERGFIFIKMNFSHNGVTPDNPVDFVDLEAFGNNNFSVEQEDISLVIDYIFREGLPVPSTQVNKNRLYLTGHSRGGAAAILKGYHDDRVKGVASWAGINDYAGYFTSKELETWARDGVIHVTNSRTGQKMPLYYQIVMDYLENEESLNVKEALRHFHKPLLIIHGSEDQTVPVEVALQTKDINPGCELLIIEGADHVFGGGHPWRKKELPEKAELMINKTIEFFNENL